MSNNDTRVEVKNNAPHYVGFAKIYEQVGEVSIAPRSTTYMYKGEVVAQCSSNNPLFTGVNGKGDHAEIFIVDDAIRAEALGLKQEESTIKVFDVKLAKAIFDTKNINSFKKKVRDNVITDTDKINIVEFAKTLKLDSHSKIAYIEEWTGLKVEK